MAPSFDFTVPNLLCEEDDAVFFGDTDFRVGGGFEGIWDMRNDRIYDQSEILSSEGSFTGLPLQTDECLALMIQKECEHMPAGDYLKRLKNAEMGDRETAIDWMGKVHAYFSFGPVSLYLSINFFDRFLSACEIPKGEVWTMQLLAVACFSLAIKMEETEVPLLPDLQVCDPKFVFEARTIQKMELFILSTLKWRMQVVTPFSFVDSFLRRTNGDQIISRSLISKSTQLVLSTVKGIDFLEFMPSEIAAAVAMSVAGETHPIDIEKAMSVLNQHVKKERLLKCVELMNDLSMLNRISRSSHSSIPQSPIGVLDAACLNYATADAKTVESYANSCHNSAANKRRKLNRPWGVDL